MKYKIKHIILSLLVVVGSFALSAQEKGQSNSEKVDKKEKIDVLYGTQQYNRFVGNMDSVSGEKLSKYPSLMLSSALQGQLPGVYLTQNYGSPGTDSYSLSIRGTVGDEIILVDGVERPLSPYDIEQIQDVKVFKDPISKALYGGRKSNGVIVVTTKRGKEGKSEFHLNVEKGIKRPTILPSYLNSYDFANAYNQAYFNDKGVANPDPKFSPTAIRAYQIDSAGFQYPNIDFYNQFLNKQMDITRVNGEYYGGNRNTKFYVHGGYQKEGGFEAFGDNKRTANAFNLQGNLDSKFSEMITLHANIASYLKQLEYPGSFDISTLSSRYPNAYPIIVTGDSAGGTDAFKDNPFAGQAQSGYVRESHIRMQSDFGLDFNLNKFIKGLTFKPHLSFDIYHKQNLSKINTVGIYQIGSFDFNGNPFLGNINTLQTYKPAFTQSVGDDDYTTRWAFTNTLAYQREFGNHALDLDLVYFISQLTDASVLVDYKRQNLGFRANYTYSQKYTLEGVLNYCGSQSFEPSKRFKLYPAIGAGWLVSKENFLKDVSAINFLKVNASWGIMGDGNVSPNQWRESWGGGNSYAFNNSNTVSTVLLNTVYSPILDWPTLSEMDFSIEALLFKHLIFKASYFEYFEKGNITSTKGGNTIPSIIGYTNFLPQNNFGETSNKGVEINLSYKGESGDFKYELGSHFTYARSSRVKIDEVPDPNYTQTGTPWDATWGYLSDGKYTSQEIDAFKAGTSTLPLVSFMDSKTLLPGNIKYKDLNADGVIDKYDTKIIGNNAPRILYGGNLMLSCRGVELYAMVVGYGDFNRSLNGNAYYAINGTRKYSTVVTDGLPNGNAHPLLTTTSGINDFQSSDYWIVDASYMKLQNVALSYSLPKSWVKPIKLSNVKLSLYGTDLFTFSKITKTDPQSLDAGIGDYPLFTTYAFGISITL